MRRASFLVTLVVAAACGGGGPKTTENVSNAPPATDPDPEPPRSELRARQDAACERVGPKLTTCAVEDAKKTMTPAEVAKLDLEKTGPIHTREFIKKCREAEMSSRQVRVYEVCLREEEQCDPFLSCLDNAKPQK